MIEELEYVDENDTSIGHAQITFMRTPLREGEVKPDIAKVRERMGSLELPPLDQPVEELAGIIISDAATGTVTMMPKEAVRRPGGFVQGAIMTLIGEVSAQTLAETHHDTPCVVTALDVRYLIGGRSGPLVTQAKWIGNPGSGMIKVDLLDEGHDVLSCSFLAQVEQIKLK
jgi:acyl-coenzyme A thioesterase PaaI-like protein